MDCGMQAGKREETSVGRSCMAPGEANGKVK